MPGERFSDVFGDIITEAIGAPPIRAEEDIVPVNRTALVIEDDSDIRALLEEILDQAGFEVHSASTGVQGLQLVEEHRPVVTTLDVSMPGMDGFETAKRIRAISDTYIVMLTARSDEIDTLQGLQSGADDYITKPFRPRELRARIEAMLRRPRSISPADEASAQASDARITLRHGTLAVDPDARIAEISGAAVELTRSEFDILIALMESGRRVVSKSHLARAIRDDHAGFISEHDERAIEVHMTNLRRKLGDSPSQPRWIETVRGVGYRLTSSPS